uniref:Glutaredoxin domain-containing protein n=2 Tax=Oryza brachyantha TaxID=4533 RepID=J3LEU4_ORYBR
MAHSSSSYSRPSDPNPAEEPSKPTMALDKASNSVVVFSKTYCPFCARVKQLLAQLGASYKAVELDVESDGSELQAALANWTGQRTVPCVFIKGKHIGGCDDTMAMHKGGNLVPLLTDAGATTPSL